METLYLGLNPMENTQCKPKSSNNTKFKPNPIENT